MFSYLEKKLIYKNSKKLLPFIEALSSKVKKFSVISRDGLRLSYWYLKGDKPSPVVIFCHGNLDNISHIENQKLMGFLNSMGYSVFAIDYRGFGESEGNPEESGLYTDLEDLIQHINLPNEQIVLWGHSLGAAVVIDIASKMKFAGVILDAGFTSIEGMRDYLNKKHSSKGFLIRTIKYLLYNTFPVTQKFESNVKISKITSPTLIMHGQDDHIVPFFMGEELSRLKPDARTFFPESGHHVYFGWQKEVVEDFLSGISQL